MKRRQRQDSELHAIVRDGHDLAKTTRERYLRDLDIWIDFAGIDRALWTRKQAQDFYNELLTKKRLKPQSANRLMASIQYASKWWAHTNSNPDLDFALVRHAAKRDQIEKRALLPSDAAALVQACIGPDPWALRDFALIVVGLETGMRRMSLRSMRIEETLIEPETIQHRRAPYPVARVFMKGTGDTRIAVPLSDVACEALRPWLRWLGDQGIRHAPVFQALDDCWDKAKLVVTASGDALSDSAITAILDRRSKLARIARVNPHMFRHSFITWRAQMGLAPHEIAAVTGHTVTGIGALGGYMDLQIIGEKVRNTTPDWLRRLVQR